MARKEGALVFAVGIVGWHNSGKTTLGLLLLGALRERGLKVGVIKHAGHAPSFDSEGSDSWRYADAGANFVALASSHGIMTIERFDRAPSLDRVLRRLPSGLDMVLVEGYKGAEIPKIEVRRGSGDQEPITEGDERLALLISEWDEDRGPIFDPDSVRRVVDLICAAMEGDQSDLSDCP